jgi:hypothetical protein
MRRVSAQAICWNRGRPARNAPQARTFRFPLYFALRAHCGRDARGSSKSLDRWLLDGEYR